MVCLLGFFEVIISVQLKGCLLHNFIFSGGHGGWVEVPAILNCGKSVLMNYFTEALFSVLVDNPRTQSYKIKEFQPFTNYYIFLLKMLVYKSNMESVSYVCRIISSEAMYVVRFL